MLASQVMAASPDPNSRNNRYQKSNDSYNHSDDQQQQNLSSDSEDPELTVEAMRVRQQHDRSVNEALQVTNSLEGISEVNLPLIIQS